MPPSEVPEQDRGGNTPPPNPDQGHQEGPTIPGTGCYHPTTITGVKQLVAEYDRRLVASESDTNSDTDENDEEINEDQHPERREEIRRRRDRNYESYLQLVKLIPVLKDRIVDPHEGSRMLYYAQLLDGANNARSDDTSRVKSYVATLLNTRSKNRVHPPLDPDTRDGRGLQNDFTGGLLCPIKYNWDDLAVRAKIRDGIDDHNAFDDYWIRCLYEGERGDLEDVERGFLKSTLLVKTFQMIFTSPSSARGDLDAEDIAPVPVPQGKRRRNPSKRPPVAAQLKMDGQVTARSIAYAAVQLHFALNDATHWMSHYNGFNYEEFYEFIIDFLEEDVTPEGKAASNELLGWWNRCVFPRSAATRAAEASSVRRTSLALVRQQRQARRQPA